MDYTMLKGTGVAMITPFKENYEIDYNALEGIIEYFIESGIDYIVVMGTTAESPVLSLEEKKQITEFTAQKVNGRIPLVYGHGGNNTYGLTSQIKEFDLSGYTAILSVVPYYNKPTQKGIYKHFETLAGEFPLPVILYNIPGRTGVNMNTETIVDLSQNVESIIGVKEASGNMQQISEVIQKTRDGFLVLSGDDALTLPLMAMGGDGVISASANGIPAEMKKLSKAFIDGNIKEAQEIHHKINTIIKLFFTDGNPAGVKVALSHKGKIQNILRLPLCPASKEVEEKIVQELDKLS